MSGVREKTEIASKIFKVQEQTYHRLAVPLSLVRPLTVAASSYSLESSLRSSRPLFRFLAAQAAQMRRPGLIPYRRDVKA
jgi:hypothetical protein